MKNRTKARKPYSTSKGPVDHIIELLVVGASAGALSA